jgi:type II secretory pathway pseudopilin PulG
VTTRRTEIRAAGIGGSSLRSRRSRARRRDDHRHGADRHGADDGITLIEIVITVTLLALVVVPILIAVTTSIKTSRISESAAQVETLLVNAVDRVNRSSQADFPCSLTSPVTAAVETVGWPASAATVYHEYLEIDGTWKTDDGGLTACRSTGFQNGIVQRVTITITSPEDGVSRSLQVVRGDI